MGWDSEWYSRTVDCIGTYLIYTLREATCLTSLCNPGSPPLAKTKKLFRGIALLRRSTYGLKNLENSSSLSSRELSIYSGHKLRPSSCNTCKCFCFWLRCGDPDRTLVKVLPAPGYLPKAHCSSTQTRYLYLIPTQPKKKQAHFCPPHHAHII